LKALSILITTNHNSELAVDAFDVGDRKVFFVAKLFASADRE
jgi:hypothetical protein